MNYPKINSIFKRDPKTFKFTKEYSDPIFKYLRNNIWTWKEKIDGTNIRIIWDASNKNLEFKGRKEKSIIPEHLLRKLKQIFTKELFIKNYPGTSLILYGEGFGFKIQRGELYLQREVDFLLFDVLDQYWLNEEEIKIVADNLNIKTVPTPDPEEGTLIQAIKKVKNVENPSAYGCFEAEGLVLKPKEQLLDLYGERVITKIKYTDFQRNG